MGNFGELDDGFGNTWPLCRQGCEMQIVRPGKVQCDCDYREQDDPVRRVQFRPVEDDTDW